MNFIYSSAAQYVVVRPATFSAKRLLIGTATLVLTLLSLLSHKAQAQAITFHKLGGESRFSGSIAEARSGATTAVSVNSDQEKTPFWHNNSSVTGRPDYWGTNSAAAASSRVSYKKAFFPASLPVGFPVDVGSLLSIELESQATLTFHSSGRFGAGTQSRSGAFTEMLISSGESCFVLVRGAGLSLVVGAGITNFRLIHSKILLQRITALTDPVPLGEPMINFGFLFLPSTSPPLRSFSMGPIRPSVFRLHEGTVYELTAFTNVDRPAAETNRVSGSITNTTQVSLWFLSEEQMRNLLAASFTLLALPFDPKMDLSEKFLNVFFEKNSAHLCGMGVSDLCDVSDTPVESI